MAIRQVDSQGIPSYNRPHAFDPSQLMTEKPAPPTLLNSRSQRIHQEASQRFFPARLKNESLIQWSLDSLKTAKHGANAQRELERLANRWSKLRRAFNDWLDEIAIKKNNIRLERAHGFGFRAKLLEAQDPFHRLLAYLLSQGKCINQMEEPDLSSRNYRTIYWQCVRPTPRGTGQDAA